MRDSTAAIHLVVSSIQVLTTSPIVESWGHFPRSKARLLALLAEHNPSGLVLLSGDVHHAELSGRAGRGPYQWNVTKETGGGAVTAAVEDASLLEITTSGMTHTCTSPFYGFMCPYFLKTYSEHRMFPSASYTDYNW